MKIGENKLDESPDALWKYEACRWSQSWDIQVWIPAKMLELFSQICPIGMIQWMCLDLVHVNLNAKMYFTKSTPCTSHPACSLTELTSKVWMLLWVGLQIRPIVMKIWEVNLDYVFHILCNCEASWWTQSWYIQVKIFAKILSHICPTGCVLTCSMGIWMKNLFWPRTPHAQVTHLAVWLN
jgi:hypothetical protein